MRTNKLLLLVGVLSMIAAACGGSKSPSESGSKQEGSEAAEEALGLPPGSLTGDGSEAELQIQEAVAACMKAEGFEYVPYVPDDANDGGSGGQSEEWVKEWGFGISTQYFPSEMVGEGLKGQGSGPDEDPNQAIVTKLSASEQEAYQLALWGELPDEAEPEEDDDGFGELPGGCYGEALLNDPVTKAVEALSNELEAMQTALEADPRVVDLNEKLNSCISEKGYEFTTEEEYYKQVISELDTAFPEIGGGGEGGDPTGDDSQGTGTGDTPDPATGDDSQGSATGDRPGPATGDEPEEEFPTLTEDQKTTLGEIQTKEIAVATAAFECGFFEGGDYRTKILEIEEEYLKKFVEENEAAIKASQ